MMKLFDHISIHLYVISFGFDIANFLLVEFEITLELWGRHWFPLVIGLLFFSWFFWAHTIIITYNSNCLNFLNREHQNTRFIIIPAIK
jgi:hypothetical protein